MTQKKWLALFAKQKKEQAALSLPPDIEEIRQKAFLGHCLEQVLWGKILLNSTYVPSNPAQARVWFRIAADAGYGPAWNMLGRCAHFGWGDTVNLLFAAECYENAARLDDEWGRYNLGILFMRGLGMPQNLKKALMLFQQAAHNGHAKSMNILARFLEEGWEIKQDRNAAVEWYRRSAENGDYRGQHNYATYLIENKKTEEALLWWEKALPDATSDILFAMQRALNKLNHDKAITLRQSLLKRLENFHQNSALSLPD
ncbi:tetratricopeptide repeat protein [Acetobacter thailandicus]|uniref:Tetratricopeptide repeat protein n=1 Tax=Acetobacter thailandicus TaxID=1502842 RepID=A0ABT3QGY8_9PROT|nr:tetratricopeptide repeat protein [Acetobacter thailandicus]MCX2564549.1 tetratricopeptide repeat protein [Acetobacter thailandicus]NHN96137.1 sel1 repeat family protein [Acetobacter thailandicus]